MFKGLSKTLLLFLLVIFTCICCNKKSEDGIPYSLLITGDKVKKSGDLLQGLPLGLNEIIYDSSTIDTVIISVHGYDSRGYEWVYPVRSMAESKKQTFYYRWDWTQCPESATEGLLLDLKKLLIESSAIRHIIIFGHSYGGVITANLIDDLFGSVEIHSVAAPLYGHPRLDKKCPDWPDFEDMELINPFTQWRTQQKQDGAYKHLATNPQEIEISGSNVVQLPDSLNGRRLGHNRSISWVINKYFKK